MSEDLEHRVIETEQRSKSNTKRIDELEERVAENEKLSSSVAVMANEMGHMKTDISSMDSKLDKLIAEPGNDYKDLKGKIVWALIAAVIALVLSKIGLV